MAGPTDGKSLMEKAKKAVAATLIPPAAAGALAVTTQQRPETPTESGKHAGRQSLKNYPAEALDRVTKVAKKAGLGLAHALTDSNSAATAASLPPDLAEKLKERGLIDPGIEITYISPQAGGTSLDYRFKLPDGIDCESRLDGSKGLLRIVNYPNGWKTDWHVNPQTGQPYDPHVTNSGTDQPVDSAAQDEILRKNGVIGRVGAKIINGVNQLISEPGGQTSAADAAPWGASRQNTTPRAAPPPGPKMPF